MTFLLVVYFFCLTTSGECTQGQVYQEKYDVSSAKIDDCITIGRKQGKALSKRHAYNGDFSFMCIAKGQK
jgi:hypothetical protein